MPTLVESLSHLALVLTVHADRTRVRRISYALIVGESNPLTGLDPYPMV